MDRHGAWAAFAQLVKEIAAGEAIFRNSSLRQRPEQRAIVEVALARVALGTADEVDEPVDGEPAGGKE